MFQEDKYHLKSFDSKSKVAQKIFDQIDLIWEKKGEKAPVSNQMKFKLFKEKKFENFPFIFYYENQPLGIVWIELTTPFYGSVNTFISDKQHCDNLFKKLIEMGFFKNKILEIVAIDHLDKYKLSCFKLGLTSNIRNRMYLWLNQCNFFDVEDHPFELNLYSKKYIDWAADLSVRAHKISKDYEFYVEMQYPKYRKQLEEKVIDGLYGKIIEEASLVLEYNQKPVAYCLVVEVKCWGYEKVPWVFDICVDPAYHGQGMGNILTKYMLNKLIELNYELMGLAVTLTNKYAIKMYQKFGFENLDTFYEFVDHDLTLFKNN